MTWFRNLRLRQKMMVAFGLVLVLMIAQSIFVFISNRESKRTNDAVAQSYETIRLAQDVLNELLNMETGYRGFLLTGRDEFLEPYISGDAARAAR